MKTNERKIPIVAARWSEFSQCDDNFGSSSVAIRFVMHTRLGYFGYEGFSWIHLDSPLIQSLKERRDMMLIALFLLIYTEGSLST